MKKRILFNKLLIIGTIIILANSCKKDDTNTDDTNTDDTNAITDSIVKDIDGNEYHTVTIGTQVWMAENLRTTHFRNGDSIPNIIDTRQWAYPHKAAFCTYNNTTNNDSIVIFGLLYNGFAITDSRKIAPLGWHVPTVNDWDILFDYLGDRSQIADVLKDSTKTYWKSCPGIIGTNTTGFTALPGGYRFMNGNFYKKGERGCWWSSTESFPGSMGDYVLIEYDRKGVYIINYFEYLGLSVRCVKD